MGGEEVGHVVFGHVVNTEPRDMYMARVAALEGGCGHATSALTVNRLCGSGLQAIVCASQSILLGDCDIAIGGGAENMSRAPYASTAMNPNGSGISLGHPIGATGALITVKAIHELIRIQGRYALVTMCIGGGQGIAAIFERC